MRLTGWQGRVSVATLAMLGCTPALSQATPDAGALQRQIEQNQVSPLPGKSVSPFLLPQPLQSIGGATVNVDRFAFSGNTLLGDQTLTRAVSQFVERPLDFSGLQNAALAVATAYRNDGWIVRVYLPEQDVSSGTVTIQIVEARLGAVRVDGNSERISNAKLKHVVQNAQTPGSAVNSDALDRALLLVSDLPGVTATGRLTEGLTPAETDLILSVTDTRMVYGQAYADNTGSRFTGAERLIGNATINSPLGIGDQVNATMLYSKGSTYVRTGYSLPLGHGGWRVGLNASHLGYNIVTSEFAALDAHGRATTVGVNASYPMLRSRHRNLYLDLAANNNRFHNKSAGATSTQYGTRVASFGLVGNLFDSLGGGGANTAGITYVVGEVDLDGSPNQALDAMTTSTSGSFHKALITLSRHQTMTRRLSLHGSVSAQLASKNLDSSERFYLGGAGGVRAYPANEGGGSRGLMLNLEARASLPHQLNLTGFLDAGRVQINKHNNFLGAAATNVVTLKGAGLSIGWTSRVGLNIRATVAHRIGSNPNPTSTGTDQDGSLKKGRFWLQASLPF